MILERPYLWFFGLCNNNFLFIRSEWDMQIAFGYRFISIFGFLKYVFNMMALLKTMDIFFWNCTRYIYTLYTFPHDNFSPEDRIRNYVHKKSSYMGGPRNFSTYEAWVNLGTLCMCYILKKRKRKIEMKCVCIYTNPDFLVECQYDASTTETRSFVHLNNCQRLLYNW